MRGERELAAGLMPIEDERLEVRARSIDRGGETSAAAADDNDVVHSHFLQPLDSALRPPDTTGGIVAFPPRHFGIRAAAKLESVLIETTLTLRNARAYIAGNVVARGDDHDGPALSNWKF